MVDIRTKAADPATSIVDKPKAAGADGQVSLLVADDDRMGEAAFSWSTSGRRRLCAPRPARWSVGENMELDALDQLAASAFDGYIVRKDLALRFRGQYPVPTYVGEFLLGRYCASTE